MSWIPRLVSSIRRDPLCRLALAILVLGAAAEQLAPPDWKVPWRHGTTSALLVTVLVAVRRGSGDVSDPEERRFWSDLALAHGLWLGGEMLQQLHFGWLGAARSTGAEIAFSLYYTFMVLAGTRRPGSGGGALTTPLRSDRAATAVFVLGLALYSLLPTFGPARTVPQSAATLYLFAGLDVFLVVRFWTLARGVSRLRTVYGLLTGAALCLAGADVLALASVSTNDFYNLALGFVVLAASWKRLDVDALTEKPTTEKPATDRGRIDAGGLSLLYAPALALLHIAGHHWPLLDPADEPRRAVFVIWWTILLTALAVLRYRPGDRSNGRRSEG